MKWSEMSVFYKITAVVGVLCAVAYSCIALFSLFGFLPNLYTIPWAQVLFGISWAGQAILNWKNTRVLAIFNIVCAILAFVSAFLGWLI